MHKHPFCLSSRFANSTLMPRGGTVNFHNTVGTCEEKDLNFCNGKLFIRVVIGIRDLPNCRADPIHKYYIKKI